jgi:dolichol-phosphate mannosyltransferase
MDADYEVIFVDDGSTDGSGRILTEMSADDRRVKLLSLSRNFGHQAAITAGLDFADGDAVVVMDADLQHDGRVIPAMLERLRREGLDVVVASRYLAPGGTGNLAPGRVRLSGWGTWLSRLVTKQNLSDPMSGFFALRRGFFEEVTYDVTAIGFKIMLDIVASAKRPVRIGEVPYTFGARKFGESKLDVNVGLEYLYLVMDKLAGRVIPMRFALFAAVGTLGVALHLLLIWVIYYRAGAAFRTAQIAGTYVAMTGNFLLNNAVTFRERRLRGWALATGFVTFTAACSIGALTNVSLAEMLVRRGTPAWMAAVAGLTISSVWNYGVNEVFTWRRTVRLKRARVPKDSKGTS